MEFYGTQKQKKWAEEILQNANLTDKQLDNLLRWAGPKMYDQGIMYAPIIIDNRHNLSEYSSALGSFYAMTENEKKDIAQEAANTLAQIIKPL